MESVTQKVEPRSESQPKTTRPGLQWRRGQCQEELEDPVMPIENAKHSDLFVLGTSQSKSLSQPLSSHSSLQREGLGLIPLTSVANLPLPSKGAGLNWARCVSFQAFLLSSLT